MRTCTRSPRYRASPPNNGGHFSRQPRPWTLQKRSTARSDAGAEVRTKRLPASSGTSSPTSYTASPTPMSHRLPAPVRVRRQRSPRAIRDPLEQVRRLVDPAPVRVQEDPVELLILSRRQGVKRRLEGVVGGPSIHVSRPRAVPSVGSAFGEDDPGLKSLGQGGHVALPGGLVHLNAVAQSAPQTTATPQID